MLCFDCDVAGALSVVTRKQPFNLCYVSFNLAGITSLSALDLSAHSKRINRVFAWSLSFFPPSVRTVEKKHTHKKNKARVMARKRE